ISEANPFGISVLLRVAEMIADPSTTSTLPPISLIISNILYTSEISGILLITTVSPVSRAPATSGRTAFLADSMAIEPRSFQKNHSYNFCLQVN
ncbi:MAG: hypothetical protein RR334_04125, partial [Clostridia bacterium]